MTLVDRVTNGDGERLWLRTLPCTAPHDREQRQTRGDFLRLLHPTGYRDLRALLKPDGPLTKSAPATDLAAVDTFISAHPNRNLYVGVATRKRAGGRDLSDCDTLHVVFADLDLAPTAPVDEKTRESELWHRLSAFPLAPTATVDTGGGWHLYWALVDPIDLRHNAAEAKDLLRRLATVLGADLSAAEPARILRIPGTQNFKFDPPRRVQLTALSESRRYTREQIEALLPTIATRANDTRSLVDEAGKVGAGNRNLSLFKLARSHKAKGIDESTSLDMLRAFNRRKCDPPHDDTEVGRANSSAYGQADRFDTTALVLDPNNPLASAEIFVERTQTEDGTLALRHRGSVFYRYSPAVSAYVDQEDAAIRAAIYKFSGNAVRRDPKGDLVPFQPNRAKVDNVLDALRAITNLPSTDTIPRWLADDPGLEPLEMLACSNGLLHIPTRRLYRATPTFFTLNGVSFPFDPEAPNPVAWQSFLRTVWPTDDEAIATLQEWFGYLLTPDTRFQKILMLVGPKRSGKGTIGRVGRGLLGDHNLCGPTLANMAEQFGLSILIGKSAAIIADARIGGRTDTSVITERLLSISGEDTLSVPRKFLPDWTGKLSTRFLLLTNELPRIEDASGALASRFIVLTLNESFYGREDPHLFDRFVPERPGILLWALEGRDRLYARGRFEQPKSAADLIEQFEDLGSPIGAFVRDCCEIGRGVVVAQADLFEAWKLWCGENGRTHPGTIQTFGRNLRAHVAWLGESRTAKDGTRVRNYEGIRLRSDPRPDYLRGLGDEM